MNDYAYLKALASPGAHDAEIADLLRAAGIDTPRCASVIDTMFRKLQTMISLMLNSVGSGDDSLHNLALCVEACEQAQHTGITAAQAAAEALGAAVRTVLDRQEFYIDRASTLAALCVLFRLTRGWDQRDGGCDTVGASKYAPRALVLRADGKPASGLEE